MSMTDDDDFLAIMEGVELAEPEGVVDVTTLSDLEVVDMYAKVRQDLLRSHQMTADSGMSTVDATDEGRTLHSLRVALLAQMAKRNLR